MVSRPTADQATAGFTNRVESVVGIILLIFDPADGETTAVFAGSRHGAAIKVLNRPADVEAIGAHADNPVRALGMTDGPAVSKAIVEMASRIGRPGIAA